MEDSLLMSEVAPGEISVEKLLTQLDRLSSHRTSGRTASPQFGASHAIRKLASGRLLL